MGTHAGLIHESGPGSAHWKGGRHLMALGYAVLRIDGKDIYEHRFVMSKKLGRPLKNNELVHHINHNKLDNRPENLELYDRSAHMKMHTTERWKKNPDLFKYLPRCGAQRKMKYRHLGPCKKLIPCCRHPISQT
jgi:hypothetical protein